MKLVYIAGPYRGASAWQIENNIRRAEEYGIEVARMGGVPVIPHSMYRYFQDELPDEFFLAATLEIMKHCDAALFTAKWKKSQGAMTEHEVAESVKLHRLYSLFEVGQWLKEQGHG